MIVQITPVCVCYPSSPAYNLVIHSFLELPAWSDCHACPTLPHCDVTADSFRWVCPLFALSPSLSVSPSLLLPSLPPSLLVPPVEPSQPVGGEDGSAAPVQRGDMGNAQKKPHGRGDGGPHSDSNPHHGHWKGKGGSSDKYKASQETKEKVTNGTGKRGSTASVQADQSSGDKGTLAGGSARETVNLDAPCGALPPPLARLKNQGNLLFRNGQFAEAVEKYSQAIQGYTESGTSSWFRLTLAQFVTYIVFVNLVNGWHSGLCSSIWRSICWHRCVINMLWHETDDDASPVLPSSK